MGLQGKGLRTRHAFSPDTSMNIPARSCQVAHNVADIGVDASRGRVGLRLAVVFSCCLLLCIVCLYCCLLAVVFWLFSSGLSVWLLGLLACLVYLSTYLSVLVCLSASLFLCLPTSSYIYLYIHICIYRCIYIYIYIHIHIHTYVCDVHYYYYDY